MVVPQNNLKNDFPLKLQYNLKVHKKSRLAVYDHRFFNEI